MSKWSLGDIGATMATGGIYGALKLNNDNANDVQRDYQDQINQSQSDYQNYITQGMSEGRKKASDIYGASTLNNLGSDISGIVSKRKELTQGEDPSIGIMKRQAAKQQNVAQSKMAQSGLKGAYAQKAVGEMNSSNQAQIAAQKYKTDQANLNAYQSLLGNIAAASTATELGYGQMRGAGVLTPTAPERGGLLGSIFG